jgi:hypothetical protein
VCWGGETPFAYQKRSVDRVPKYSVEQTQKQKRYQTGDSSQETGSGRGEGGLKRGVYVFLITSRAKTTCSMHKF